MRIEISSAPPRRSARSRTDDGLWMERLLIDQIGSDLFAAAPGIAFRLRQAREQSDFQLAEERKESERGLLGEQSARDAAVAALADREELPSKDLPVRVDPDRIFQVLTNLLSNAIKITPRGGQISVTAARQERRVRIAVRDTGLGIADSDLKRIFNPYCQVGRGQRHGLGLGLFISRSIVQAHGGRIWAESRPGSGTTFYFTVPRASGSRWAMSGSGKAPEN